MGGGALCINPGQKGIPRDILRAGSDMKRRTGSEPPLLSPMNFNQLSLWVYCMRARAATPWAHLGPESH